MVQEMDLQKLDMELAIKPWTALPQEAYVLTGANLIDPLQGQVIKNATIRIEGGLVTEVSEQEHTRPTTNDGTTVIDARGKYILPGLIDCHVHIMAVAGNAGMNETFHMDHSTSLLRQPKLCQGMLDRGFTSVRDCAGATPAMRQAIEDGVHPGPRLFIAGKGLSQTGGHGDLRKAHDSRGICCACGAGGHDMTRVVDGVPDCLKYAREELRRGADFIKIMSGGGVASPTDRIDQVQFSDEEIKAIVTVATNARTYVTSHAYTPQAIQQAISHGVRGIEHGNLLDEETARLMASKGVFLTPTLVVYATMARPEFSSFLPPFSAQKNSEVLESGLRALKIATDAGVTICFGTDLLGPMHPAQTNEFVIRSQVQTPLQIIQSATVNAARLIQREETLGRIAPGFLADFLILNANPLEDIAVLDRPDQHLLATIKDGRVVSSRWSRLEVKQRRLSNIA
ncbi:hypothetical protein Z517_07324 [Fonsecaea pedrosoi CBS 271.37]|uniref:Unplaced genomic scaffold supercont1.4, whole genome shotgun sequence n=1 Tax=Fonsecaea pedrosoi CBS 271.37 TaxID=1442368 RepID=A0A0D2GIS2_9EURO|nr:uncharacterized protein Z517_07324 [Fonsecaea pedrosoi CBS 271.37]KIW80708.1 hypothetical protein Z517_07324 [Fonsecaea pedrosoi CBS 271.37]